MSIASALTALQADVTAARTAITAKGGTITPNGGTSQLATDIATITGGGGEPVSDDSDILFVDIDGNNLYGYTRAEALQLTELPPLPTREGLVCERWNWTLGEIKTQCNAHMKATIGPLYHTISGKEEFVYIGYVEFIVQGAKATIDWGDGTSYVAEVGEQVSHSTVGRRRGSIVFETSDGYIKKPGTATADDYRLITEYYMSGNYKYPQNIFGAMEIFSASNSSLATGAGLTARYAQMKCLVIPRTGTCPFAQTDNKILKVSLPGNRHIRSIPYTNAVIKRVDLPALPGGDDYLGEFGYGIKCLQTLDIPQRITTIPGTAFRNTNLSPKILIVRSTTPPTIAATLWVHTTIYVPYSSDHSILNAYKAATGWSTYAEQMYELDINGDIPE